MHRLLGILYNKVINPIENWWYLKKINTKFSKAPIIIGGCGRSGTSLLLSILSAHPHVYGIPKETSAFAPTAYSLAPDYEAKFKLKYFYKEWLLPYEKANLKEGMCFCEKTPKNVRYYRRIIRLFKGNVKIINIVRDGRDVILSHHPTKPNEKWVQKERWVRDVKEGLKYKDVPQVLTIKYENLILNYEETIKLITDFCEIDLREELFNWIDNTQVTQHSAWGTNVQPLNAKSIGKWKREIDTDLYNDFVSDTEVNKLLNYFDYR